MSRIEGVRTRRGALAEWVTAHRSGKTLRAEVVADIDWLLARLAAVEALHPDMGWGCGACSDDRGPLPYPCPTVRAARGEDRCTCGYGGFHEPENPDCEVSR